MEGLGEVLKFCFEFLHHPLDLLLAHAEGRDVFFLFRFGGRRGFRFLSRRLGEYRRDENEERESWEQRKRADGDTRLRSAL